MKKVTPAQFAEILETMTTDQTVDSGFAISHFRRMPCGGNVIAVSDANGGLYASVGLN